MRLADFIDHAQDDIVEEAVAFARTLAVLTQAEEVQVRNHLPEMLRVVADDLRQGQSRAASLAKSRGQAASIASLTQADAHGKQRAQAGLQVEQLLAEYRALRASVLRLWQEHAARLDAAGDQEAPQVSDIGRFNEAVDQAIAESVRAFVIETEQRRQIFLAALGHDLRGPLNAVLLTAETIAAQKPALQAAPSLLPCAQVLSRSAQRMSALLDSFLVFNVAGLGEKITLTRRLVDLAGAFEEEMQILRATFPHATIDWAVHGPCEGAFDASRMREALANLVSNAVKHGEVEQPVVVRLQGDSKDVRLTVANAVDRPLTSSQLALMFEPLRRGGGLKAAGDRTHLGLGLFITREIAKGHGGTVEGACQDGSICFTLIVPKATQGP